MEGDILQDPILVLIGEPYVFKFDLAPDMIQFDGIRLVYDIRDHVQDGKVLLGGRQSGLQPVEHFRQVLDGVEETGNVHIEADQNTGGDGLPHEGGILDISLTA